MVLLPFIDYKTAAITVNFDTNQNINFMKGMITYGKQYYDNIWF